MKISLHKVANFRKKKAQARIRMENANLHQWVQEREEDYELKDKGSRIIELDLLQGHILELTQHAAQCQGEASQGIHRLGESRHDGLASTLVSKCRGCGHVFKFVTSSRIAVPGGGSRYTSNIKAVWGEMGTGGGCSTLTERLATLDIPCMSSDTFSDIEELIGQWWASVLDFSLAEAAEIEKEEAIKKGNFSDGIPSISVICDGGWSKRTHRHSYNAFGGVAIIIGRYTQKVLHIGVKTKTCQFCAKAKGTSSQPENHNCYQNWTESSQAMEAAILKEGFSESEEKFGLRYTQVIADGDSKVYKVLREEVPYGRHIEKIDCANHICKNLQSHLENIVTSNPSLKGVNGLTQRQRIRIATGVRCAIRMRSKMPDRHSAKQKLRHDIMNSINHVFDNHEMCSKDFCKTAQKASALSDQDADPDCQSNITSICEQQQTFWEEVCNEDLQDDAMRSTGNKPKPIPSEIRSKVCSLLSRIACKVDTLIEDKNTNLAEVWMGVRCRFDGGKSVNRCQRGSWQHRCTGAALRCNLGPRWSPILWALCTSEEPSEPFQTAFVSRQKALQRSVMYKQREDVIIRRRKRKLNRQLESATKKAQQSYGPKALQYKDPNPAERVTESDLRKESDAFFSREIDVDGDKIQDICLKTSEQSDSYLWKEERRKRITASFAGPILKRNVSLKVAPVVKSIMSNTFRGNKFTRYGLKEEQPTIADYIEAKRQEGIVCQVHQVGLIIDAENPWLGCSPDGVVTEDGAEDSVGLLEIKNVLKDKNLSLVQACQSPHQKNFCLQLMDQEMKLRRNHNYFYQILTALHVSKKKWIDFVVRTTSPHSLHIERFEPSSQLWRSWLDKLKAFYFKCLLPSLTLEHLDIGGIWEPGPWVRNFLG